MNVEELFEELGPFKETVPVVVQIMAPGPKGGVIRYPIKGITVKYGKVVLIANEAGQKD